MPVAAHVLRAGQQPEAAQVFFIAACLTVAAADLIGEVVEAGAVQTWHQNRALIVLEQAAVFLGHRRAFGCADAEDQQRRRLAAQGFANALALLLTQRRGEQQNSPLAQRALLEQGQCLVYRQVGALAVHGHD